MSTGYYDEPDAMAYADELVPYGERKERIDAEQSRVEPRYESLDCPQCGTHTDKPRLHWIAAVEGSYSYDPAHMEVDCGRCGYAVRIYRRTSADHAGNRSYFILMGSMIGVLLLLLIVGEVLGTVLGIH